MQPFHFKKIGLGLTLSVILGAFAVFMPVITNAAGSAFYNPSVGSTYTLLAPLPCLPGQVCDSSNSTTSPSGQTLVTSFTLDQFIGYAYKFMLALAVALAVFMITIGGFEYMTSAVPGVKSGGLTKLQDAIMGLLLALCAYLILYTIDPTLVAINTSIPNVCGTIGANGLSTNSNSTCNINTPTSAGDLATMLGQLATQDRLTIQGMTNAAQQLTNQAQQLYDQNDCSQYDSSDSPNYMVISSDAPAECLQAQQISDQANTQEVQALTTQQTDADKVQIQNLSNMFSGTKVIPYTGSCPGEPAGTSNAITDLQYGCYNGYQIYQNGSAVGPSIANQFNLVQSQADAVAQQVAPISNGSQASIIAEKNKTMDAMYKSVQTYINQGIVQYQQQQQNIQNGMGSAGIGH